MMLVFQAQKHYWSVIWEDVAIFSFVSGQNQGNTWGIGNRNSKKLMFLFQSINDNCDTTVAAVIGAKSGNILLPSFEVIALTVWGQQTKFIGHKLKTS